MESLILEQLKNAIEIASIKFGADKGLKDFEKASKEFDELIEKGIARKRGYNLLTITENHLHRINFNIQKEKIKVNNVDIKVNDEFSSQYLLNH